MITTVILDECIDIEPIVSILNRDSDIDITVVSDLTEVGTQLDDVDCIIGEINGLAESSITIGKRGGVNSAWIALYEDGEEAAQALSLGIDQCVHRDIDQETTAAHLAEALRQAVDHQNAELSRTALNQLNDLFFVFDVERGFIQWNQKLPAVTGYEDNEIMLMDPSDFVADTDEERIATAIKQTLETGTGREEAVLVTKDNQSIPYEFTGALLRDDAEQCGEICVIGRDITDRKRRQRALAHQTDQLRTLNHINEVIRDVNQALVRASTREEIEEAVCTNLAKKKPYRFAWIGTRGAASTHVTPRAWAGVENGYLDNRPDIEERTDGYITAATAIQTGEIQVAQRIAEDPEFEPWREAALERGYQSAIAVPLRYRETTYGVLCVYAPRPNAFDADERTVLANLSETIAYAISATEQRRALVATRITELEFRTRDQSIGYVDLSAKIEGEVVVEGVSPIVNGRVAAFLTIRGADCETVLATVDDRAEIEATVISDQGDECVVRFLGPEPSVSATIADYGGRVRSAHATDGKGRFVVEVPSDADIRAVVDGIEGYYDHTELFAQRERDRTSPPEAAIREAFDNALTDRQREVLRVAYLSGFFEWPRKANSEEVADLLDITKPTFHEHIRTCERKFVSAYFEHQPPVDLSELMA